MRSGTIMLILLLFLGCQSKNPALILVSKDNHSNIAKWLHMVDSTVEIREFYAIPVDSMEYYLSIADAIVLGGGEDVHPSLYGHKEYLDICGDIDLFRDSIERVLIHHAFSNKLPLLGICRGQQILNAATGGTLIPDITTFLKTTINHRAASDSDHVVRFSEDSWLKILINCDSIGVNSRHHQCVDKIAPGFVISGSSPDGVIESIQYADTLQQPFIAGVQWHPEGLLDEPSLKIATLFLSKIKKSH